MWGLNGLGNFEYHLACWHVYFLWYTIKFQGGLTRILWPGSFHPLIHFVCNCSSTSDKDAFPRVRCAQFFSSDSSRKFTVEVNCLTIQLSHNTEKKKKETLHGSCFKHIFFSRRPNSFCPQRYCSVQPLLSKNTIFTDFHAWTLLGVWNLPLFLVLDLRAIYWQR